MPAPHDRLGRPGPPVHRAAAAAVLATSGLESLPHDHAARLPQLLEAMSDLGTGSELHSTLERIVHTAARVADCRYAAVGVLARGREGLEHFVTHGLTFEERTAVCRDPDLRHGLLGSGRRTFLGFPVKVDGRHAGDLYLTDKHGGGDFTADDALLVKLLATEAGIAVRNARLNEAARRRERWIEGSAAVTTSLLSGSDHAAHDALTVVAEQARRLADAAAGIVLLPTDEGGLEIVAASAEDAQELIGTVMRPGSETVGRLLAGEPVFVDDPARDPRMPTPVAERFGPSMMLPLQSGGRIIGTLAVPRAAGAEPFTGEEKTLAAQFAAQAALALVLADAQRDRERLAVYEDRDRIARDLHDLVIQRLFSAGMTLQATRRRATEPAVAQGIEEVTGQLDATISEIRTAIFALQQDPGQAPAGLRTRVLREAGLAAEPLGFQPSVHFAGPVDSQVGEATAKALVAAVREALSNASRHAAASRVEVTVDAGVALPDGSPGVRLTVADDGVGIPPEGRRSGLDNLARRAESLGGTATWSPGLGREGERTGTTLTWQARR
ncbi:GAF domain-containing protein [Streptomyces sp. N2-109]|uniref:GAF domain-containing protein n=1 Tax=Streptomyces gossypii TaxID=2883101 RepID=A0ABT2JN37_9ACTN|nr:GAF domain-containing protein [Streptomyces gossypii]MCT2589297.1 GAF domain-containing protein [Streptomyces gossypii]